MELLFAGRPKIIKHWLGWSLRTVFAAAEGLLGKTSPLLALDRLSFYGEKASLIYISLIAMMAFGRGVTPDRPSWSFVYGNQEDDAELVMAEALATQNNPYELKAPEMTTTVGPAYRERMFGWIQEHHEDLFLSRSDARVVVLHSSSSRDVIDGTCFIEDRCGMSLYASNIGSVNFMGIAGNERIWHS